MKRKKMVSWSIVLLSVSMVLLIVLQVSHITSSYKTSSEIIERSLNEAINRTIISLEKQEVAIFVYDKIKSQKSATENIETPKNQINTAIATFFDEEKIPDNTSQRVFDKFEYSVQENDLESIEAYFINQFSDPKSQFNKISMQIEAEFAQRKIPIEKRFDAETISKMLKQTLTSFGIEMDFEFAIIDDSNMKIKISSEGFDINRYDECYKYNMTPGSLFSNPDLFLVDFSEKKDLIWESIYTQVVLSLLVSILFLVSFGIAIFSILKQKKLDTIKTDFINNMTHEFKTPIATIKLAATAIRSPQATTETTNGMVEIILQETARMTQHIEQVLQIASLDRSGLKLNLTTEDANEFVKDVASNMDLTVSEKGGKIILKTCDSEVKIQMDLTLMTTVLMNLIDNAIKYSQGTPEIQITTYTKGDRFCFLVKDNGIGISKDAQAKIFDRFYRATTGNTHNIKGFGLGLNYAREIVLAHGGLISVTSTIGKGSEFTVSLPLTLKDK